MERLEKIKKAAKLIGNCIFYTRIRYVALTAMLILTALSVRFFIGNYISDENVIAEAFSDTDVIDNDSILELTAYYNSDFLSEKDKRELVSYIVQELGIKRDSDISYTDEDSRTIVEYKKQAKQAATTVKLVSTATAESNTGHYLLVRLEIDNDSNYDILEYRDKFTQVLNDLNVQELYTTIQLSGRVYGQLSLNGMNEYSGKMLDRLGGQVVYDNRVTDNYIIYAYSAAFPEYIKLQDSMINIQITMEYNEADNSTYIKLATPISR